MVESSKILTVSYGTFSCTLEGFDDSFSTMKAIAEYFRDLAERDRYFGAEPPTPDAEMLTRIAEREIERRVEARTDDSGIVLRAAEAVAEDAANVPAMPPVAQPPAEETVAEIDVAEAVEAAETEVSEIEAEEVEAIEPADFQAESDEEMDVAAETTFEDMAPENLDRAEPHPDASSVAAKLQRIRAVVGGAAGAELIANATDTDNAPEPFDFTDAEDAEAEDDEVVEIAETLEEDTAEEAMEAEDVAVEEELASEEPSTVHAVEDVATEETVAEDAVEEMATEEESVAVETVDDLEAAEELVDEDQGEEEAESFFAQAEEDDDAVTDEEVAAETPFSAIDTALIASIAAGAAVSGRDDDDADVEAVEDEPKPSLRARILRSKTPEAEDVAETEEEPTEIKLEDVVEAIDSTSTEVEEEVAAETTEGVSIATLDGADELKDFDDLPETTLSDEDEAELQANLSAALEDDDMSETLDVEEEVAELEEEVAEIETLEEEEPFQLTEAVQPEAAVSKSLPDNSDEAMSRIMDQADEQLSEPEGSRRRNAIAQLKAAVAATEAAKQLGDAAATPEEAQQEFRKDFDEVVRPRRADSLPRAEVRKERPRPAPLKLVASQRIDDDANTNASPVAPRRIAAQDDAAASSNNFAEYAEEVGAKELPDLLEAAAAYSAYVEGNEDFSRPQIMRWVQQSTAEEFSREDSLRSFGTLLRDGRISKVRNGRFQVTEQTRFRPEQKAG